MQVGKYTLVREIGSGQFGTVYLATSDSQLFALKSVRFRTEQLIYLYREVHTMNSIFSPFVVKLCEDIWTDDSLFLAMEYCPGGTLEAFLKKNQVAADTVCRWLWEIARAIADIHSCGIMHRDLKPANILLTEMQESAHIKVSDLGAARFCENSPNNFTIIGSGAYMAPELFNGEKYDEKVDVWSFGVIANQLLRGPLFQSIRSPYGLMLEYERTQEIDENCGLNSAAVALIKATLSKDPQQRPSFSELLLHPFFQPLYQYPSAVEVYAENEAVWVWELAEYFRLREVGAVAFLLFSIYQREAKKRMNFSYWDGNWSGAPNATNSATHSNDIDLLVFWAEKLNQEFLQLGETALYADLLQKTLQLLQIATTEAPLRQGKWAGLRYWILTKMNALRYIQ